VTYRYKQPFADGLKPIQYGLIAEDVADVYPENSRSTNSTKRSTNNADRTRASKSAWPSSKPR
jgi:hypothetical protein